MKIDPLKPQIRIFPNGQFERGNGKPGYDWHPAYSQKNDDNSVSNPMLRREWQSIARRDGAMLVICKDEQAATLPKL